MWTQEHRERHRQCGNGFPSDLTDAERERLAPLVPAASPGGRPRKTDMRAAMNAILYLLRTGCPWRYLPRDGFPPLSTVYNIFRKFQREGTWEAIWAELHLALRERLGREASPRAFLSMEIVRRSDDTRGFVVQPRRWVVERCFSWFGRNRRLAKDYENLADTLAAFVAIASIRLALKRLARLG
ncbi:transposase [Acuticoccus sp. I52.16.1]|uniref:transposase n=1 Tax=Acuticoccus sp. I52.16.1 TaxID=2928472 RepID=UPI001FD0D179|nr:transposase [Acuticoccus sp. I52.16.1]UOM36732.1 transposase [Acuticoccus sp. I52.16.1]